MSRYKELRLRVDEAARKAGRSPSEVILLGASKAKAAELVVEACRNGLVHVGENFAQEAREKIPAVDGALAEAGHPRPSWHFIGRLQRNKARLIVPLVECVQSVDRLSLARELDRRAGERDRPLEIMLQVNLSAETTKGGVAPDALPTLLRDCAALPHLRVVGLMAIPAPSADSEKAHEPFRRLRELRDGLSDQSGGEDLVHLSMGMSGDFEIAIAEGATVIRIGTALFGARENKP